MNIENRYKPLCFIPARGGSKRFPRKNIAMLKGKPLIAWSITSAIESGIFDKVYVSSEDDEILQIAKSWGATPLIRKTKLAGDRVSLLELCLKEINKIRNTGNYTDLYLLLPTSPFRKPSTIRNAWRKFLKTKVDTLMSVIPCEYPPQWSLQVKNNCVIPLYPSDYQVLRQDLETAFIHDGGHLIIKISSFLKTKSFIGAKTMPFFVSAEEAIDIDVPMDLIRAEFFLEKELKAISK